MNIQADRLLFTEHPQHENETSHPVAGWGVFSVSGLRFLSFCSMI